MAAPPLSTGACQSSLISPAPGPGAGEIRLDWQAPVDNGGAAITGYKIYSGASSSSQPPLATVGKVLMFTDSSLSEGQTKYYKGAATNIVGEGIFSAVANAQTFTRPTAPQNLQAAPGIGRITLVWQSPSSEGGTPVTGYVIYRGLGAGAETSYDTGGSVLTHVDTACPPPRT